jgi:hypothetical protein
MVFWMRSRSSESLPELLLVQKENEQTERALHMQRVHLDQRIEGRRSMAISTNDSEAFIVVAAERLVE